MKMKVLQKISLLCVFCVYLFFLSFGFIKKMFFYFKKVFEGKMGIKFLSPFCLQIYVTNIFQRKMTFFHILTINIIALFKINFKIRFISYKNQLLFS